MLYSGSLWQHRLIHSSGDQKLRKAKYVRSKITAVRSKITTGRAVAPSFWRIKEIHVFIWWPCCTFLNWVEYKVTSTICSESVLKRENALQGWPRDESAFINCAHFLSHVIELVLFSSPKIWTSFHMLGISMCSLITFIPIFSSFSVLGVPDTPLVMSISFCQSMPSCRNSCHLSAISIERYECRH